MAVDALDGVAEPTPRAVATDPHRRIRSVDESDHPVDHPPVFERNGHTRAVEPHACSAIRARRLAYLNTADFAFKTVVIAIVQTSALIGVGSYAASLAHHQLVARTAFALIIGGAAGNLVDRIVAGSVVDFVDVYWRTHHFWAFNVADSAITIGVAVMILDTLGAGARVSKTD